MIPPDKNSVWLQLGKASAVITGLGSVTMLGCVVFLLKYWPTQNNVIDLIKFAVVGLAAFGLVCFATVGLISGIVTFGLARSKLSTASTVCSIVSLCGLGAIWGGVISIAPSSALVDAVAGYEARGRTVQREKADGRTSRRHPKKDCRRSCRASAGRLIQFCFQTLRRRGSCRWTKSTSDMQPGTPAGLNGQSAAGDDAGSETIEIRDATATGKITLGKGLTPHFKSPYTSNWRLGRSRLRSPIPIQRVYSDCKAN